MSPSEQTGRLAQTSTLHRIHLALTRSLCWFKISRLGRLTSLLYYSTNDQSSIFSLHSLELCKLKRCLIVCLKHRKTLWKCIVFLCISQRVEVFGLFGTGLFPKHSKITRSNTCYNMIQLPPFSHWVPHRLLLQMADVCLLSKLRMRHILGATQSVKQLLA